MIWKQISTFGITLFFCTILIAGRNKDIYFTEHKKEEPELEFIDNKIFDFGKVKEDTLIKHKFWFVNTGSAPLFISSSQASCQCTKIIIEKKLIPPQDSSFIELTLSTSGKNGFVRINGLIDTNTEIKLYKIALMGYVTRNKITSISK